MTDTDKVPLKVSTFISKATFVVTIVGLIPAFLSLNKENARVHHAILLEKAATPAFVDEPKFRDFLKDNNIPSARLSLQIKNAGNAPANEVKVSVTTPGDIVRCMFTPSATDI